MNYISCIFMSSQQIVEYIIPWLKSKSKHMSEILVHKKFGGFHKNMLLIDSLNQKRQYRMLQNISVSNKCCFCLL